jgi:hypothetical protein
MAAKSSAGEVKNENMQNQNDDSETKYVHAAQRDGD